MNVEDEETIELPDAEVKSAAQSLAGVVVDTDGKPMPGITISARAFDSATNRVLRGIRVGARPLLIYFR